MFVNIGAFARVFVALALFTLASCGGGSGPATEDRQPLSAAETGADPSSDTADPVQLALTPFAPYDGGRMDVNTASAPQIAVTNPGGSPEKEAVTGFEFELYSDQSMSAIIVSGAVERERTKDFTVWSPEATLAQDATYYWRVRPTDEQNTYSWSGPFSFQVVNACSIPGSRYAERSVFLNFRKGCDLILPDASAALGPPDAVGLNIYEYSGFVSLTPGGELGLEMGRAVVDGPGNDLRIYEYVSMEVLEVFVGPTEMGPWTSLGVSWCTEFCDFDLGRAGVRYARYIKIKDMWSLAESCHQTVGVDIDAVTALHYASNDGQCAAW